MNVYIVMTLGLTRAVFAEASEAEDFVRHGIQLGSAAAKQATIDEREVLHGQHLWAAVPKKKAPPEVHKVSPRGRR